jgi:hypothetical protein
MNSCHPVVWKVVTFTSVISPSGKPILSSGDNLHVASRNTLLFPEGEGFPEAHVLVIGVRRMGEIVIYQAVRAWWNRHGRSGKRLLVTLVDRQADIRRTALLQRYPSMHRYADLHARTMDVQSAEFLETKMLPSESGRLPISTIYICLGNPSLGLMTALALAP